MLPLHTVTAGSVESQRQPTPARAELGQPGVPAISGQNCRFNGLKLQTGRLLAGLLDSRVQACFMKTRCAENTIRVILHADFDFLLIHFVNYNHSLLPPTPRGSGFGSRNPESAAGQGTVIGRGFGVGACSVLG